MNEMSSFTTIGQVIRDYRKKNHFSQKMVYDGICSESYFSKMESGSQDVNFFMFDAFISRMGLSTDDFDIMYSTLEDTLFTLREEIQYALRIKDIASVRENLSQYQKIAPNDVLHQQFIMLQTGRAELFQPGNQTDADVFLDALCCTKPGHGDALQSSALYSAIELSCYIYYVRYSDFLLIRKQGIMDDICNYIHTHFPVNTRAELEGMARYYTAEILYDEMRYEDAAEYTKRAVDAFAGGRGFDLIADAHFLLAQSLFHNNTRKKLNAEARSECLEHCRMAYYLFDLYDEGSRDRVACFAEESLHGTI